MRRFTFFDSFVDYFISNHQNFTSQALVRVLIFMFLTEQLRVRLLKLN